jgi:hypothetical protein
MPSLTKIATILLWILLFYRLIAWFFLELPIVLNWPLKATQSCKSCQSLICKINCELRKTTGFTNLITWYLESGADPIIAADGFRTKVETLFYVAIYTPFYIVMMIALAQRKQWIRVPSLCMASIVTHMVIVYGLETTFGVPPSTHPWIFLFGQSLEYLTLVTIFLRMIPTPLYTSSRINRDKVKSS